MKKLVALAVMVGILSFSSVSYAQIAKWVDSFDERVILRSLQENIGEFKQFNFTKEVNKEKNVQYNIYVYRQYTIPLLSNGFEKYGFAKDYMEIKIDQTIYKANVTRTQDYSDLRYGIIFCESQFPEEAIEPFRSAQKVTLRFHREDGSKDIVEVPSNVLTEWKQVINATEWDIQQAADGIELMKKKHERKV